jgi:hypothetical protein
VRKGLTDDTTRHRRKGLRKHQHLACRLLYRLMRIGEALDYRSLSHYTRGIVSVGQSIEAWSSFVTTQGSFAVLTATQYAIDLCKSLRIEVPELSGEVRRLVKAGGMRN